jgi:hypothetical protein
MNLSNGRTAVNSPQKDSNPTSDTNVVIEEDDDDGFIEEYIGHEVVEDNNDDDAVVDVISANMV